jgi:N6-L-threonylcarbamoyladenine synthase
MYILGIETSCDETSIAIVKDGKQVISHVLASSRDLHEKTGGIVPEVAARKQVESIIPVLNECLDAACLTLNLKTTQDVINIIDALAVTVGPGLFSSLIIGVNTASILSTLWNKPLIPVNHLVGHLYANFIDKSDEILFPALGLVISGGHTDIVLLKAHGEISFLGGTIDDAAGEAFDKTARLLGIAPYLGGAKLSKLASTVNNNENPYLNTFPRPLIHRPDFDFSFSGLKTAVRYFYEKNPDVEVNLIANDFENAVVDVVSKKISFAIKEYSPKSFLLGGGVAANSRLRGALKKLCIEKNVNFYCPSIPLCMDNGIFIAAAAFYNFEPAFNLKANPSLNIAE